MNKKDSFGLPFNGTKTHQISVDTYDKIFSKELTFVDKNENGVIVNRLDTTILNHLLLKELAGTYTFKTNDKDLLRQENIFFYNLFFYGRIGIAKINNRYIVVRINDARFNEYKELISANVKIANILFDFSNENNDRDININGNDLVIFNLDNNMFNFYMRYGWLSKEFINHYEIYLKSIGLSNKSFLVYSNTKNSKLIKEIFNDIEDPTKSYIHIPNPKFDGNFSEDASKALEKDFLIEDVKKEGGFMEIETIIKFWKFGKDILGMNANTAQKKERLVSTEVEDASINTNLLANVEMKNLKIGCFELKEKFGLQLEIVKTIDELDLNPKNSSKANNDFDGNDNGEVNE